MLKRPELARFFLPSILVLVLFINFWLNPLSIADPKWFRTFNKDNESWVIGRIIRSRQDGILSYGGFLGWGWSNIEDVANNLAVVQYKTYFNGGQLENFKHYASHPGAQGWVFFIFDRILVGTSPPARLLIFSAFNCLLFSFVLLKLVEWFTREFGWVAGSVVYLSCFLSQWLIVFTANLYWAMWAFYLPMVLMMYLLPRLDLRANEIKGLILIPFTSLSVNILFNGFEYITAIVVMMTCPLIYHAIRNSLAPRQAARMVMYFGMGIGTAIFFGLALLILQSVLVNGTITSGIVHTTEALVKRTYPISGLADSIYNSRMNISIFQILFIYMAQYFTPGVPIYSFITITILNSIGLLISPQQLMLRSENRRLPAVIITTWVSLAAPFSWFIIFRAHSTFHFHINPIAWQMPFTIFGAALIGLALQSIVTAAWQIFKTRRQKIRS